VTEPDEPDDRHFLPGPAPQRRSGEYVVMPAHSSGAAESSPIPSGILTTKSSVTTMWVE
jgi:hypothetical protein